MMMLPAAALGMSLSPTTKVGPSPFASRALSIVQRHPIVQHNACAPHPALTPAPTTADCALWSTADTEWFAKGEADMDQARTLVTQFSVFSNLFLLAQLNKVINAPTKDEM